MVTGVSFVPAGLNLPLGVWKADEDDGPGVEKKASSVPDSQRAHAHHDISWQPPPTQSCNNTIFYSCVY